MKVAIVWSTDKTVVSYDAVSLVVAMCLSRNGHQMERVLDVIAKAEFIQLFRIITFVI